ncbi:hypothetical protein D3C72_1579270 [compost metagenome]
MYSGPSGFGSPASMRSTTLSTSTLTVFAAFKEDMALPGSLMPAGSPSPDAPAPSGEVAMALTIGGASGAAGIRMPLRLTASKTTPSAAPPMASTRVEGMGKGFGASSSSSPSSSGNGARFSLGFAGSSGSPSAALAFSRASGKRSSTRASSRFSCSASAVMSCSGVQASISMSSSPSGRGRRIC